MDYSNFGGPGCYLTKTEDYWACRVSDNDFVKKYEVISIEPTDLANHWVLPIEQPMAPLTSNPS